MIRSMPNNRAFEENYDSCFGKRAEKDECSCGRYKKATEKFCGFCGECIKDGCEVCMPPEGNEATVHTLTRQEG